MKSILAIIGSQKSSSKSITAAFANLLINTIKKEYSDVEVDLFTIGDKEIKICEGCMNCSKNGKCIINDDLNEIINKIKNADLILLGSPVHISHVSATYKNFLDRIHAMMHTFEFLGKPFVSVVTTNGSGEEDTEKYINHTALLLGLIHFGTIVKFNNEPIDEKKINVLAKNIGELLSGKQKIRPSFKNSLYFWSMKKIIRENKSYFEYEDKVWMERGWYNSNYKKEFALRAKN